MQAVPPLPLPFARTADERLVLLTRALSIGGAERQLVNLAAGLHARGRPVTVVSFYAGGPLEGELRAAGVRLYVLDKRGRWDAAGFLQRLTRVLRAERPAVLHGYLDVPNLLGLALRPLLQGTRVVWGIRATPPETGHYDWFAGLASRGARVLARHADLVIVNAHATARVYRAGGVQAQRLVVIPNGIDTRRFRPLPGPRAALRAAWGIPQLTPLVGLVGRLDPMKGHEVFLEAAAGVLARRPDARFVCVGEGDAGLAQRLRARAQALGLEQALVWAPPRLDVAAVYAALDVACSASVFGEGFPNVVAEAMACGIPCVVTDVGDSAHVVGRAGRVVPPRDVGALARELLALLALDAQERAALGEAARRRVAAEFSLERLVDSTERVLWPTG